MNDINLQSLQSILLNNGVEFAGIFGSRARGDNKANSDLDVLVRFEKDDKSLLDVIRLQNELSDSLGIKVDVLTEGSISPLIKEYIYNDLQTVVGSH